MSRKVYPVRIARYAHGIRAQDLRTLVRKAWWARQWIAALESFRLGARLGRGRQYALTGQVIGLKIAGPHVEARVLGSRPDPYAVTLDFTLPPEDLLKDWSARLKSDPILLARVMADDLPTVVGAWFAEAGVPLFPVPGAKPPYDVRMTCSCPDWAKPCKHVAAVMFLLGEEIARHPATLLACRGLDVETFFPQEETAPALAEWDPAEEMPLADRPEGAVLERLGPVPFWRGTVPCLNALTRIYSRTRTATVERFPFGLR